VFHGWRVVTACCVVATVAWALGTFGASVYLQAVTAAHGWPIADVAFAVTLFYLVSALVQRSVGRAIDRWGPRPLMLLGTVSMTLGVAGIGQVAARWQLYPCFVLIGLGWAALSTTGIAAAVAPWFERHQGRSMALAIMGASIGAIVGVPTLQFAIRQFGLGQGLAVVALAAAALLLPLIARVLRFRGPQEIGMQRDGGGTLAKPRPCRSSRSRRRRTGRCCCGARRQLSRLAWRCRSASSPITSRWRSRFSGRWAQACWSAPPAARASPAA
jgi:MFS family permease